MMKNLLKLVCILLLFNSCKNDTQEYPMEKPIWDITDYEDVIREIKYGTPEGEKFPGFTEKREVFLKLTDKNSIAKILDDSSLGLQYRKEYSDKLFGIWKTLVDTYSVLDRQDKYIYPLELVKMRDCWYFTQIKYFKLGNDEILKGAINEKEVESIIRRNENTVVGNFVYGISFLTEEEALNAEAISEYSKVLNDNYAVLIKTFPKADYSEMEETIDDILKKVKSDSLKQSLNEIKKNIEAIKGETVKAEI